MSGKPGYIAGELHAFRILSEAVSAVIARLPVPLALEWLRVKLTLELFPIAAQLGKLARKRLLPSSFLLRRLSLCFLERGDPRRGMQVAGRLRLGRAGRREAPGIGTNETLAQVFGVVRINRGHAQSL